MANNDNYWRSQPQPQPVAQPIPPAQQQPAPGVQPAQQQPAPGMQQPAPGVQPAPGMQQPTLGPQPAQSRPVAQPAPAQQPQPAPAPQPGPQPTTGSAPQQPYQQQAYSQAAQFSSTPTVPQKKSHGWIVAIVIIVCLFAFTAFCVHSCSTAVSSLGGVNERGALSGDTVAVINIAGTIQYDGTECSPEGLKDLLDEAESDNHIKAVVLRVNSGGGTATAGEEMAEYVRQFSKPIVVSSASINASAAYEISSQADYIFVAKSTEIGAIGTAMQLTDLSGLLDMLGIKMDVITSAEEKDSSYGFRPLTDAERAEYQHMVDQINSIFIENVATGRGMTVDAVKKLATGMPFTGMDAVSNGLADAVGTREDALDKAAELAGISSYEVTELYVSNYDLSSLAYLLGESDASVDDLIDALKSEQSAKLK